MAYQLIYPRRNEALRTNPPAGDAHLTTRGSDWLWAVFAVMLLSWFVTLFWVFATPRATSTYNRIIHFIPTIVLATASVAYFSMASDLGWTLVRSSFSPNPTRQIWFVRYIQWFINAPLVLLVLLAFVDMATPEILTTLFFTWFLVVNGLVGALVPTSYKWAFFVFGLFGLFFIWAQLFAHFGSGSFKHPDLQRFYIAGAGYISFVWMLYPICWGLSEGSNVISPTSEMVFYGILDILSGPVFLLTALAHLSSLSPGLISATAFGTADRGKYGEQSQRQKVAPQAQVPAADSPPVMAAPLPNA